MHLCVKLHPVIRFLKDTTSRLEWDPGSLKKLKFVISHNTFCYMIFHYTTFLSALFRLDGCTLNYDGLNARWLLSLFPTVLSVSIHHPNTIAMHFSFSQTETLPHSFPSCFLLQYFFSPFRNARCMSHEYGRTSIHLWHLTIHLVMSYHVHFLRKVRWFKVGDIFAYEPVTISCYEMFLEWPISSSLSFDPFYIKMYLPLLSFPSHSLPPSISQISHSLSLSLCLSL